MTPWLAAFLLGIVAGLRVFTAPAVLWLIRHPGPLAYGLGVVALLEYAGDLSPRAPSRTAPTSLIARLLSGGFCGWALSVAGGGGVVLCVVLGMCGALVGAYGGLAVRLKLMSLLGSVPAALLEDVVAIAAAVAIVL
jgi:uncharacterized membrane protein